MSKPNDNPHNIPKWEIDLKERNKRKRKVNRFLIACGIAIFVVSILCFLQSEVTGNIYAALATGLLATFIHRRMELSGMDSHFKCILSFFGAVIVFSGCMDYAVDHNANLLLFILSAIMGFCINMAFSSFSAMFTELDVEMAKEHKKDKAKRTGNK